MSRKASGRDKGAGMEKMVEESEVRIQNIILKMVTGISLMYVPS